MVKKKCNLNSYIYIKVQSNRSNITLYVHFCIVKRFIWCLGNCVNQFNDLDVRTITSIRALCVRLDSADSTSAFSSFAFSLFFFFFIARVMGDKGYYSCIVHEQYQKFWLFSHFQHISGSHGTHKLHFSANFSLKMGPMILFTHLKIISLQYFQFQQK